MMETMEKVLGNKRVNIILADNCVRYVKFVNGKKCGVREYENHQKEKCVADACKWLEK